MINRHILNQSVPVLYSLIRKVMKGLPDLVYRKSHGLLWLFARGIYKQTSKITYKIRNLLHNKKTFISLQPVPTPAGGYGRSASVASAVPETAG